MDEEKKGGARRDGCLGREVDRKKVAGGAVRGRELVCKKRRDECVGGVGKDSDMERGGVQKEGRSEGRAAGRVYICHLLLLQAKNAQEEQGRRKRSRRRRQ